jgi:hypothetical protein
MAATSGRELRRKTKVAGWQIVVWGRQGAKKFLHKFLTKL